MAQSITGGAQNLNGGSTLASAPAQTATGLELATMQDVKSQTPTDNLSIGVIFFGGKNQ